MPPRTSVVDLDAAPPGAPVRLAGRVLAAQGERLLVADATGTVGVTLEGTPPRAGDLVELSVDPTSREARVIRVLTPCRDERPFPSPGGEYYRLHQAVRGVTGRVRADLLALRSRCFAAIRAFFAARGYIEVQTPHRVRLPGLEPHLVAARAGDGFLITSPEYHMKRLLAAGLERIYFLGPCWRSDEQGPQHLPEFTMLEWYRAYSDIDALMVETEALVAAVARDVLGETRLRYAGQEIELGPPWDRLTFARACRELAGVELAGVCDAPELRRRARAAGLGPFEESEGFDAVASRILVERVEPGLVGPRPVFLHDFPAPLAALARLRPDDPTVAERFELYAGGLELANAFGELTDADEQRRRLEEDRRARAAAGAPAHALDERFLAALAEGIPPSAGIALGVDRLVMLLSGAADIRDVVAFAPDEV